MRACQKKVRLARPQASMERRRIRRLAEHCSSSDLSEPERQWNRQDAYRLDLRRLCRLSGFCVLTKPGHSFQISQGCFVQRDEPWLDFEAMLLFQVRRQLRSRSITDFRNSTSEEFHRLHSHPPGLLWEPARYRQAGWVGFSEGGGRIGGWFRGDERLPLAQDQVHDPAAPDVLSLLPAVTEDVGVGATRFFQCVGKERRVSRSVCPCGLARRHAATPWISSIRFGCFQNRLRLP
jgi:hypothetical protein